MRSSLKIMGIIVVGQILGGTPLTASAAPKNTGNNTTYEKSEVDNSKVNKQDDAVTSPTADQQNNDNQDVETTRKIRRALTRNDTLSSYAHNVKIITQKGQVLLKGPVRSADEKRIVEAAAIQIAGGDRVKSELEIKAD